MDFHSDSEDSGDDLVFTAMMEVATIYVNRAETPEKRRRLAAKNRNREEGHEKFIRDYFSEDCVYDDKDFKSRFRLTRSMFLRIVHDLEANYEIFQLRYDGRGKRGFTPHQKCGAALRLLGYGYTFDAVDEYLRMSAKTARESMYAFCEYIYELYGPIYLRKPTRNDVEELYAAHHQSHGLPGMLGSIDCTHWDWANCPNAWKGQYTGGHHGTPSLILEAVASQDLWIWHAYFGVPGANNDLNVLDSSPIFNDILLGKSADVPFKVNDSEYPRGYLLTDGIYPNYSTFVKAYQHPIDEKRVLFTQRQESARKDVERAFGVLKKRWTIVQNPSRAWELDNIRKVMYGVIVLHNMIIEEKGRNICIYQPHHMTQEPTQFVPGSEAYFSRVLEIHNAEMNANLRHDLTEYVYATRNDETDDEDD
ncbi:hypothetical protein L2E82_13887 [Cichorium intybus]|uniref:Uncharacterized protein n=1 Tax=Cichorium intybus TaxID=13427 RepID=A0ACB9EY51_CICIN|nr:hypothetical protein L1887_38735 [Cichorium endivia]KAI3508539.1 hypothetical protein L1887_23547 [Cichorium endivia]KAI3763889.1 hypothetical protein L2E82_13887 [Cichorium intybus]